MKVVIVGATGNLGTAVANRLAKEPDLEVLGLARRKPAAPVAMQFEAVDIASDDLTRHFVDRDVVIHLAWSFQPTHRPLLTWRINVGGTARVLNAVRQASAKLLIYASSVGAYSPMSSAPRSGPRNGSRSDLSERVDETWPTDSLPTAAYGREKAYIERMLDAFEAAHPGIRVVRFRPSFVFQRGAGTQQRRLFAGPFVPRGLLQPGRLPLIPWPNGLRFQAVHADDVAQAFASALDSDVAGPFNLAAEPVIDRAAIGEVLQSNTVEVPAWLVRDALSLGWHMHAVPSEPALFDLVMGLPLMRTNRAQELLGWRARTSSKEALGEALAGMAAGAGLSGGPLQADSLRGRLQELRTGAGELQ